MVKFTFEGAEFEAFDMPAGEVFQIAEDLGWSNPLDNEDMDEIGGHIVDEAILSAAEYINNKGEVA